MDKQPNGFEPAYILHRRLYRNGFIVQLFSPAGRFSLIAPSAAKKPAWSGLLQPAIPLNVLFGGRAELKTIYQVESRAQVEPIQMPQLFSLFYLNELLMQLLPEHQAEPDLFQSYEICLNAIRSDQDLETALRQFELNLLADIGYGIDLKQTAQGEVIQPEAYYQYCLEKGFYPAQQGVQGQTLFALAQGIRLNAQQKKESKQLLRPILAHYLRYPLRSRELYHAFLQSSGG